MVLQKNTGYQMWIDRMKKFLKESEKEEPKDKPEEKKSSKWDIHDDTTRGVGKENWKRGRPRLEYFFQIMKDMEYSSFLERL